MAQCSVILKVYVLAWMVHLALHVIKLGNLRKTALVYLCSNNYVLFSLQGSERSLLPTTCTNYSFSTSNF